MNAKWTVFFPLKTYNPMHSALAYFTGIVQTIYQEWYSHLPKYEMRKKKDVNLINNLIFAKTKAESVEQCHIRGHDTNNCYTGW